MDATPIPINFAPGSYGSIVDGQVAAVGTQAYTVNTSEGQYLTLMFGGDSEGGGPVTGLIAEVVWTKRPSPREW